MIDHKPYLEQAKHFIGVLEGSGHLSSTDTILKEFREPQLKVIHAALLKRAVQNELISNETHDWILSVVYPYEEWTNKSITDRYAVCMVVQAIAKQLQ